MSVSRRILNRVAVLAVLAVAPAAEAADTRSLAEAIPADAAALVVVDVGRLAADADTLDLVRLYRDPEVQGFLAPALEYLRGQSEFREFQAGLALLKMYGLPDVIAGTASLALLGVGIPPEGGGAPRWVTPSALAADADVTALQSGRPLIPDLVLSIETTGREAFESALLRAIELIPEATTRDVASSGFPHRVTTIPAVGMGDQPIDVHHGFAGDVFVAGFNGDRLAAVAGALQGEAQESSTLAADATYTAWRERSARTNGVFEVYVGTKHALQAVPNFLANDEAAREEFLRSGLGDIEGAGYSIALESGRLRESAALFLPRQRRGFLTILDALQPAASIADRLPAAAALGVAFRVDPGILFDRVTALIEQWEPDEHAELQQDLAGMKQEFGFDLRSDLLASLGADFALAATIPKSGFIPEFQGSFALADAAKFGALLERLKAIAAAQSGGDVSFSELPIKDRPGAFAVKLGAGALVQPALCIAGDRLYFAGSTSSLKRALAALDKPAKSIASDNPDFARCVATTVGKSLGSAAGLIYVDIAGGAEFGLNMAVPFIPVALSQAGLPFELEMATFPTTENVCSYLSGLLSTVRLDDTALAYDASSPFGGLLVYAVAAGAVAAVQMQQRMAFAEGMPPLPRDPGPTAPAADPDGPWIGVYFDQGALAQSRLVVVSPIEGGPAHRAGVVKDDEIVALDGEALHSYEDLANVLRARGAGASAVLTVLRGGESLELALVIGRRGDIEDR